MCSVVVKQVATSRECKVSGEHYVVRVGGKDVDKVSGMSVHVV